MKFLELQEGLSINKEEVEAIDKIDDFNTRIYLNSTKIEVRFPYVTLLQLLQMDNTIQSSQRENKVNAFLDTAGHFAG